MIEILWQCADLHRPRGGKAPTPRWRVRCADCGACYVTVGWRGDVEARERCNDCAHERVKKP
jgi:hypothetical protein